MQQLNPQTRQVLLSAIRTEMEGPLRETTEDDHVVVPFHEYIVRPNEHNNLVELCIQH